MADELPGVTMQPGEALPGNTVLPDNTAVRVALWRALHVEVDAMPHVLTDTVGLQLAAPPDGWRARPDMHPQFTAGFRASIVARARFMEDLVEQRVGSGDEGGVVQYVVLGAGLDTFAQRRADLGGRARVFEVDQPGTQEWKRKRLAELGYDVPSWLHFAPSNFEGGSWWADLLAAGFDPSLPAIVASTGVSMYLTKEANAATLRQLASSLACGSTLVMSFLLPQDLVAAEDTDGLIISQRGAAASGTPFLSFFTPSGMMDLARSAGFRDVRHVSSAAQNARYFAGRSDGLHSSTGEDLLVATVWWSARRVTAPGLADGSAAAISAAASAHRSHHSVTSPPHDLAYASVTGSDGKVAPLAAEDRTDGEYSAVLASVR